MLERAVVGFDNGTADMIARAERHGIPVVTA